MIENTIKAFVVLFYLILLGGCTVPAGSGDIVPKVEEVVKKAEHVKPISSDIDDGRDKQTFTQRTYALSSQARLLVRYLRFSIYEKDIDTKWPVRVQFSVADAARANEARAHIQLCPMAKSWMMAATWGKPSFVKNDNWVAGGEFDSSQCVSALDPESIPKMDGALRDGEDGDQALAEWACTKDDEVCFDVSDWYQRYVLQGEANNGWVLVSDQAAPILIFGDGHNALGPRLQWFSTKYTWVPSDTEEPAEE